MEVMAPRSSGMKMAIDELYRTHGSSALRQAYLLTGNSSAAEDVVQDAFTRLLGRLKAIRDPEALRAYLRRTIVNLAKNYHRREGRLEGLLSSTSNAATCVTWQPDMEQRDELQAELLGLPYRQRAALVLRYCEDLSELEVATALGTSPKAVRSLVGRGLAALRNSNGRA